MATPYDTIIADEVSSTQDLASAKLRQSDQPVLIVASRQTDGRGRSGNPWWQAPRAVAASLAFRNDVFPVSGTLPLVAGLAVRAALFSVAGVETSLKWPNDLVSPAGKLGGILVESDLHRSVVGCGLNLWWPEAPPGVAGVFATDPGAAVGIQISRGWVDELLRDAGRWERESYLRACATLGAEITWDPRGRGRAVDIDEAGGLVVATADGTETLRSGEVRTVRQVSNDVA